MKKLIMAFVVLFVLVISFNATCADLVFGQDDFIYLASNKTDDTIDTAETLYIEGSMLSFKGEFEEALDAFNKAIELDPNYEAAYLARAQLLAWDLGRWRLAINGRAYRKEIISPCSVNRIRPFRLSMGMAKMAWLALPPPRPTLPPRPWKNRN